MKPRRGSKSQASDNRGDSGAAWDCELCKETFTKDDSKLLVCDYCDLYFCSACVNVSDEQYESISAVPGTCWFCPACQRKARECIKTEKLIEERCAEYFKKIEGRLKAVKSKVDEKVSKCEVRAIISDELAASSNSPQNEDIKKITMAVAEHQKYLESLEAQKRAANMIVTGVPEGDMTVNGNIITSDLEKCSALLHLLEEDGSVIKSLSRLGKEPAPTSTGEPRHPRVIKVQLENPECRTRILKMSSKLKEAGPSFSRIYLKKDMHPMVNREFQRLKKVTRDEREKPENQGRQVTYDPEKRQVLLDNVVIDEFHPTFF